jgi:hypothetical protein
LLVSIEDVKYDSADSHGDLSADGFYAFIDSLVTQLWLPVDVCKRFEDAFGLTWNATAEAYFVSEETHNSLLAQNPTFTFTLASRSSSTDIALPYAAFDLNITEPLVQGSQRYFPLKQAQNESQYTLGRVFLQEAYVVADYARHNFTVAQARHPPTSANQNLVAIVPPGVTIGSSNNINLSAGAIVGIVIGVVAVVLVAILAWFYFRRRRRQQAQSRPESGSVDFPPAKVLEESPELDGAEWYEVGKAERLSELQAGKLAQELEASERVHELEGNPVRCNASDMRS